MLRQAQHEGLTLSLSKGETRDLSVQGLKLCSLLLLGAAVAMLGGCNSGPFPTPVQATTAYPGYGDSVSQNAAVQIIDPAPAGAANTTLAFDGHRAALAIGRYWTDQVKQPRELRTSDIGEGN